MQYLGEMYKKGQGVQKDLVQAYAWVALAMDRTPPGQERDNNILPLLLNITQDLAGQGQALSEAKKLKEQLSKTINVQ